MTKAYEFNWRREVPEPLVRGCIFDRWEEEKGEIIIEPGCLFKIDEYAFFIYWKSEGRDGQCLELCQVNDIRLGGTPKDPRLQLELTSRLKPGVSLDDVSLTICSGVDMVNINYCHVVCQDPETTQIWLKGLRSVVNNVKANNLSPMWCLRKHWMRLGFLSDDDGKIPVRSVSKTFASGKTEKLIYQCMKEVGLPHDKNDHIDPEDWTFDKFYQLYHKICPRSDIEELFNSITQGKSEFIELVRLIIDLTLM